MDEEKLSFGQHWTTAIEQALDDADVVLIFLSKNSVQKEGFVQRELNYAWELSLEKPRDIIFLVPFRLDNCQIPRYLRSRQWGDYFGDKKEFAYQKLLRSLTQRYQQKLSLEPFQENNAEILSNTQEKYSPKKFKNFPELYNQKNKKNFKFGLSKPFIRFLFVLSVIVALSVVLTFGSQFLFNNFFEFITLTPTLSEPILITSPTSTSMQKTPIPISTNEVNFFSRDAVMKFIPEGSFSMGSNLDDDEKPIHAVFLTAYYIDTFEVTNAAYDLCVRDGVCDPPKQSNSKTHPAYFSNPQFSDFPVTYVNWGMANTFCRWRNARLPTEAEWERAARGEDGRTYPWGESISCDKANYRIGCVGDTTQVGNYSESVSSYGVYDMAGNVSEWISDWYSETYYQGFVFEWNPFTGEITNSNSSNPLGPSSGHYRVMKGGSWSGNDDNARSSYRKGYDPSNAFGDYIGFRCAMDAIP